MEDQVDKLLEEQDEGKEVLVFGCTVRVSSKWFA
jgi:hypothetical protein